MPANLIKKEDCRDGEAQGFYQGAYMSKLKALITPGYNMPAPSAVNLFLSTTTVFLDMLLINYPEPDFRIKTEDGTEFIFDSLRKKWIVLTPEEWVRQNFIQYLLQVKKYPASLLAVEKEIKLGELKKRFDILVYNSHHHPWMMIECKSSEVATDESVLHQALRYNAAVPVAFIVITNGNYTYGWEKRNNRLEEINELPDPE